MLAQARAPAAPLVRLRLTGHWRTMRFAFAPAGGAWTAVGGDRKTPVEESARLVLTAGGARRARARFAFAAGPSSVSAAAWRRWAR